MLNVGQFFGVNSDQIQIVDAVVPEPSSIALASLGLFFTVFMTRCRGNSAQ